MSKLALILMLAFLVACNGSDPPESKQKIVGNHSGQPTQAANAVPKPLPSLKEQVAADRIVAYANHGHEALENGHYRLADIFFENSQKYLGSFTLPARPKLARKQILPPEKGVFDEKEAALITTALEGMDKALNRILGYYANLEKYVRDKNVRDDGKLGQDLAAKIATAHDDFIAARHDWLATVQARAAEAEKIMLAQHPLERQIGAGNAILAQFREIARLLATNTPQTELLKACRQNIEAYIQEGSKPPFPAKPALERVYRGFLATAGTYIAALDVALGEGFHGPQRRALNTASADSIAAWNEFVKAANSQTY